MSDQKLQHLLKIPSSRRSKSTNGKPFQRSNRKECGISGCWSGLRWTNIRYQKMANREGKAYIILYACSLTRAVYLELLPSQDKNDFLQSLRRLIARRGRPQKIYSDYGKTFVAAAKWLKRIKNDERLHDWLAKYEIRWQFNTSRAPWWGGQFERIVGLVKQALYKAGGSTSLTRNILIGIRAGGGRGLGGAAAPPKFGNCQFFGEFIAKFRGIWALRQRNCHTL